MENILRLKTKNIRKQGNSHSQDGSQGAADKQNRHFHFFPELLYVEV